MAGWSENLVTIPAPPPALEALRQQLGKNLSAKHGAQAIDGFSRRIGAETELELALVCEARKARVSKAPRTCPAPPPAQVQFRALAAARVEALEWLGGALAEKGQDPFGDPYVQRVAAGASGSLGGFSATDSFDAAVFGSSGSNALLRCEKGDSVIYLSDPGATVSDKTITLPLRVFGTGAPVGQVTLTRPATAYEASLRPAAGDVRFEYVRCPPERP